MNFTIRLCDWAFCPSARASGRSAFILAIIFGIGYIVYIQQNKRLTNVKD